ncbi:response regulator [Carboxylicivirga sp. N1Y90]|uniref:response regulator n=1 Tax=Carboxylicivirga fragile TaxID=3417571 RepID=UPI003D349150|nr:response regulator [Marinilabiliaceae bacterium N1Y90]
MEQIRILVVDDAFENIKVIVSIYEKFFPKYELLQTTDPKYALEIAKNKIPNLIITDWNMPNISGIELIKRFKDSPELKDIPIIMASGVMISNDDLKTALDAGAVDFIRKPVDATELIARTNATLRMDSYYKELLEHRNRELTENAITLVQNQESKQKLLRTLKLLGNKVHKTPHIAENLVKELYTNLEQEIEEDNWTRFDISFSRVHANFFKKLIELHPNISPSELKTCALIRLSMPIKEVAAALNQSPDSIKTQRHRIRKKLNLEKGSLETYLAGL